MAQDAYTNQLIHEKSPYLLQHAHNPVDWYPWGEKAFEKARRENKPVFLSIGYSTCHWCHVMEEESFQNETIAQILNKHFVSIKVDREERPDIDQVYLRVLTAMTGSGGWPANLFLTPDLKPFYAGTYFPPEERWGRPGFAGILRSISQKWDRAPQTVTRSSEEIARILVREAEKETAGEKIPGEETLKRAYESFKSQFDVRYGGFGEAPKFPQGHVLSFLLRYWKRFKAPEALEMAESTLRGLASGGIFDHLGGGFHRYATDVRWHVPHFEKMLYDQAMLSRTYLEAYQATGTEGYALVAREVLDYVLRDLTSAAGVFYSAEDADSADNSRAPSQKSEGAYYLWAHDEILNHLGKERGTVFGEFYGIKPRGNLAGDPTGGFGAKNVLHVVRPADDIARDHQQTPEEILKNLAAARRTLFAVRSKRAKPHRDEKVLTHWNGLMISSFAYASCVLGDQRYRTAAVNAADFLLQHLKDGRGLLFHRWCDGETAVPGFAEDYAFFALGLLDLYEATFEPRYLREALFLSRELIRLFWDEKAGGLYSAGKENEELLLRMKEIYDGALPSVNAVAMLLFLEIGRLTMDREFEEKAHRILLAFSDAILRFPAGCPQVLSCIDFTLGPAHEITIAANPGSAILDDWMRAIYRPFLPNKVVALHPAGSAGAEEIENLVPFLKKQSMIENRPTVYVCENYTCRTPVTEITQFKNIFNPEG